MTIYKNIRYYRKIAEDLRGYHYRNQKQVQYHEI